ncbi:MAG: flagellar assembly protein FliX [Azospirillum sp.]|nr:flagellar assembly protein FliX [Azospirillum sp.]
MKIEGPGRLRGGTVSRTGRAASGPSGAFSKHVVGESAAPGGVSGASPLGGIDSLLALQEVDDAAARASRGKKRASDLLDRLEELRLGLLAGSIPAAKLGELSRLIQSRRLTVDDPRLAEVLDEIDLRAQVELAKLSR